MSRLSLIALVLLAGCEPPAARVVSSSGPPPPPPPTASVEIVEEAAEPRQPAVEREQQHAVSRPEPAPIATHPTSSQPASPQQLRIQLSAGVALPQLLPDGTQIGVSVDYKVTGQLHQSAQYVLVVESAAGETAVPVKISPQGGTIDGFLDPAVRPEHKPFKARIDEALPGSRSRTKVSNTVPLQTSY